MTRKSTTPLPVQIERTLNAIMMLYNVPEEIRMKKISRVLAMDYCTMGRRILKEFREYIEKINEENLKKSQKNK